MERLLPYEDKCVVCGQSVPEGSWVCPACERVPAVNAGSGQTSNIKNRGELSVRMWCRWRRKGRKKW